MEEILWAHQYYRIPVSPLHKETQVSPLELLYPPTKETQVSTIELLYPLTQRDSSKNSRISVSPQHKVTQVST